jgi:hypothetical protein
VTSIERVAPESAAVRYEVVLRRANGRYVKEAVARSHYAAKQIKKKWEERYDGTYYVELEEIGEKCVD